MEFRGGVGKNVVVAFSVAINLEAVTNAISMIESRRRPASLGDSASMTSCVCWLGANFRIHSFLFISQGLV